MEKKLKHSRDKDKWEYKPMEVYEVTINFNDKNQHISAPLRLNKIRDEFKKLLIDLGDDVLWHFRMEISMPQFGDLYTHKIARVHYHGLMLFKTYASVKSFLLKFHTFTTIGRIQFNEFREDYWLGYIKKHKAYFGTSHNVAKCNTKVIIDTAKKKSSSGDHTKPIE